MTTNNPDPYAVQQLFAAMRAWKVRKLLAEEALNEANSGDVAGSELGCTPVRADLSVTESILEAR
jgi:hypothetical protein